MFANRNWRRTPSPTPDKYNSAPGAYSQTIDYSNDRILLGDSHNAFVGKVLRKVGSRTVPFSRLTALQYEVRPIYNIKGSLKTAILLIQPESSKWPLLDVGSTYVFVTRYHETENLYVVVYYPHQYQLLTSDPQLSDAQLKELAKSNARVKALEAAYPQEELGADVRDHKTWNSYASRRFDANGEVIDDTVELAKQRKNPPAPTETTLTPAPAASAPAGDVATPAPEQSAAETVSASPSPDPAASGEPSSQTSPEPSPAAPK